MTDTGSQLAGIPDLSDIMSGEVPQVPMVPHGAGEMAAAVAGQMSENHAQHQL